MHPANRLLRRAPSTRRERGASLVEYALIVALVAVVCVGAVTRLGSAADGKLDTAGTAIANDPNAGWTTFTSLTRPAAGWGGYSFRSSSDGGATWGTLLVIPSAYLVNCSGSGICQYKAG